MWLISCEWGRVQLTRVSGAGTEWGPTRRADLRPWGEETPSWVKAEWELRTDEKCHMQMELGLDTKKTRAACGELMRLQPVLEGRLKRSKTPGDRACHGSSHSTVYRHWKVPNGRFCGINSKTTWIQGSKIEQSTMKPAEKKRMYLALKQWFSISAAR